MSVWGGPKQRMCGILGANLLLGVVLFAAGLPPRIWILGEAAFLAFLSMPITNGCSQAIWQSKTAPDIQGRVFAVRRMIAWASLPLAYLVAGPLADQVFEPLLAEGGMLADSVGQIIGVGVGRGIGLLYTLLGFMILLTTILVYLYPPLRQVEVELPDYVAENASVAAKG
jgi:DHA3 family macrolide efflux protein-like MFS transporter